jgi:hypothetical protein
MLRIRDYPAMEEEKNKTYRRPGFKSKTALLLLYKRK